MAKTFEKAVTGFNHNIKHKGKVYHVQTEDSGVDNPHIITHLFVGGNILASKKTSYADILKAENLAEVVRELMEEQHKEMLRNLINDLYDSVEGQVGALQRLPQEVLAARELKEKPKINEVGVETLFGEDLISEKILDEVILSYMAGGDDLEDAQKKLPPTKSDTRPGEDPVHRYPKLDVTPARPSQQVTVTADLRLQPANPDAAALTLRGPPGWASLDVEVVLTCDEIDFEGGGRGTIKVKRDQPSEPAQVMGAVRATARPGQSLELRARFFHNNRYCGWAGLSLTVVDDTRSGTGEPPVRAPEPRFLMEPMGEGPWLTVDIRRTSQPGLYHWDLSPGLEPRKNAALRLSSWRGECHVGDPKDFVAAAFRQYESTRRGEHVRWMEGFGERLHRTAPRCFTDAFAAMRTAFPGIKFPIQFITDDPHVPWELMFVPDGRRSFQLSAEHPVARWLGDHKGLMRYRLSRGTIAAVAPRYPGAMALPSAVREVEHLKRRYQTSILTPADKRRLLELLEGNGAVAGVTSLAQIGVLHYAGHGEFSDNAQSSALLLEGNSRVEVMEVDRAAVVLGRDSHALVFLNACQVGRTGAVLNAIGGWAEALVNREFGAVIAPLWSVDDRDASTAVAEFYELVLEQTLTFAEALRQLRAKHGQASQTYQSYLLFGDVMARFA